MSRSIFISIPWFTPAYKAGGPIQSVVNMVSELDSGYRFYIFTADADWDGGALEGIERNSWVDFNSHTKVWYAGKENRSDTLCKQVDILKPDILYVIGIYDWHFNLVPLFFCKHPHKIVSVRGMLHPGALRQKPLKKSLFLKAFVLSRKHRAVHFHATDVLEAGYIKNVFGEDINLSIAANFPRLFVPVINKGKTKGSLKLISIALISPMKNHLLVIQALSEIQQPVSYEIFGPVKDYTYWQACLQAIGQLPAHITVQYRFNLSPSEVEEKLRMSDVAILPSESENYGHSIIEALSAGVPVISSRNIPFNNLQQAKAGLNVERTVEDIRNAIEFFIEMDASEFETWSQGAASYAQHVVNHQKTVLEYQNLFKI